MSQGTIRVIPEILLNTMFSRIIMNIKNHMFQIEIIWNLNPFKWFIKQISDPVIFVIIDLGIDYEESSEIFRKIWIPNEFGLRFCFSQDMEMIWDKTIGEHIHHRDNDFIEFSQKEPVIRIWTKDDLRIIRSVKNVIIMISLKRDWCLFWCHKVSL